MRYFLWATPAEAPPSRAPKRDRADWSGIAKALVAWAVSVGLFVGGDAIGSEALLIASLFASLVAAALTFATLTFAWPSRRWLPAFTMGAFATTVALVGIGYRASSAVCYALAIPLGMTALIGLLVLYIASANERHTAREAARFRELGYVRCPRCGRQEPPPIDLARCHQCGAAIPENGTSCICGACYAAHWASS